MLAAVASIVGPIFALIVSGFLAVRSGYLDAAVIRALGAFVLRVAMPALIFGALAGAPLGATLRPGYLVAYGAASGAVFALGYALGRSRGGTPAAMQALGMACTNSGFLGFPIATLAVGPLAASVFAQNLLIENLLVIPGALILAEFGRGAAGRPPAEVAAGVARNLARNPLILAILAGVVTAALGVPVPAWIDLPVALLAGTAAPLALVVIGGTVAGLPRGALPPGTLRVVAGKLVLHPLAVLAALLLVPGLDPLVVATGVIFASVPMITVYPIIAGEFDEEQAAAAALFAAMLAAFVTVPLALIGLELGGLLALPR